MGCDDVQIVARGDAKHRVSIGNEDEDDGDAIEDEEFEADDELGDAANTGDVPLSRRFASKKSMANKAKEKLTRKKEPVVPKLDAATAAPPAAIRAAVRAQHEAQNALAQSSCVEPLPHGEGSRSPHPGS